MWASVWRTASSSSRVAARPRPCASIALPVAQPNAAATAVEQRQLEPLDLRGRRRRRHRRDDPRRDDAQPLLLQPERARVGALVREQPAHEAQVHRIGERVEQDREQVVGALQRGRLGEPLEHARARDAESPLERRFDEPAIRAEVVRDQRVARAGLVGDALQPGLRRHVAREHPLGGVEQLGARGLGVAASTSYRATAAKPWHVASLLFSR